MVNKLASRKVLLTAVATIGIVLLILTSFCSNNMDVQGSAEKTNDANEPQSKDKPIIIWFHNGATDPPEALSTALSSGLITHVMIKYLHRTEADWKKNKSVIQAIEIAKKSPAKLIWSRNLWPYRKQENIQIESFFDPNYYLQEIQSVRSEAKQIGADFIALDVEAYAYSIMKRYLQGRNKLTFLQRDQLRDTIEKVVQKAGQVDFVYPGGFVRSAHPYNILCRLGKNRISEDTYYADETRLRKVVYQYEIFGAYLNTVRENKVNPHLPYYLVPEIFEKSYLWSDKKGLFLYPKERSAFVVAKELLAYSENLSDTDSTKTTH